MWDIKRYEMQKWKTKYLRRKYGKSESFTRAISQSRFVHWRSSKISTFTWNEQLWSYAVDYEILVMHLFEYNTRKRVLLQLLLHSIKLFNRIKEFNFSLLAPWENLHQEKLVWTNLSTNIILLQREISFMNIYIVLYDTLFLYVWYLSRFELSWSQAGLETLTSA